MNGPNTARIESTMEQKIKVNLIRKKSVQHHAIILFLNRYKLIEDFQKQEL